MQAASQVLLYDLQKMHRTCKVNRGESQPLIVHNVVHKKNIGIHELSLLVRLKARSQMVTTSEDGGVIHEVLLQVHPR